MHNKEISHNFGYIDLRDMTTLINAYIYNYLKCFTKEELQDLQNLIVRDDILGIKATMFICIERLLSDPKVELKDPNAKRSYKYDANSVLLGCKDIVYYFMQNFTIEELKYIERTIICDDILGTRVEMLNASRGLINAAFVQNVPKRM